jgi:type II secretory pathway component GspD/PulD (secretin)
VKRLVFFLVVFFVCCFLVFRFFNKDKNNFDNVKKQNLEIFDIQKEFSCKGSDSLNIDKLDYIYYTFRNYDINDFVNNSFDTFNNSIKLETGDFFVTNFFNEIDKKQLFYSIEVSVYDVSINNNKNTGFDFVFDTLNNAFNSGLNISFSDNFKFTFLDDNINLNSLFSSSSNVNNLVVKPVLTVKRGGQTDVSLYNETPIINSKNYDTETKNQNVNFEYRNIGFDMVLDCKKNSNISNFFGNVKQSLSYVSSFVEIQDDSLPVVSSRSFDSDFSLSKYESIVLGSVRYTNQYKSSNDVFLLSKIPLIGGFFKNSITEYKTFDLVIIITLKDIY